MLRSPRLTTQTVDASAGVSPEVLDLVISSGDLEPDVAVILSELHEVQRRVSMLLIGAGVERDFGRARQLILVPTAWVKAGSADLWNALGRLAPAAAHWPEAEQAFLRAAEVATDRRAAYLVRAHDAARDDDGDEHLAHAKLLEPDHVVVRLSELDQLDDPGEQLRLLEELQPATDRERAHPRAASKRRLRYQVKALRTDEFDTVRRSCLENGATRWRLHPEMSAITHLHAGVPGTDIDASIESCTRFFGRDPDLRAGDEILWEIEEHAALSIEPDSARAGTGRITVSVVGLDTLPEALAARHTDREPIDTYSDGVRHVKIPDPDGNAIAVAEPPDVA